MPNLFEQGAEKNIADLIAADECERIHALLLESMGDNEFRPASQTALLLDRSYEIYDSLPQAQKRSFCLFLRQSLNIGATERNAIVSQQHRFIRAVRAELGIASPEAQAYLIGLYEDAKKKSFAVALHYFARVHKHPFVRELSQNPAYAKYTCIVAAHAHPGKKEMPIPLVLAIDNKDAPQAATSGAPVNLFSDGFEIIAPNGVFTSLPQAARLALAQGKSTGFFGPRMRPETTRMDESTLPKIHAILVRLIGTDNPAFKAATLRARYQERAYGNLIPQAKKAMRATIAATGHRATGVPAYPRQTPPMSPTELSRAARHSEKTPQPPSWLEIWKSGKTVGIIPQSGN